MASRIPTFGLSRAAAPLQAAELNKRSSRALEQVQGRMSRIIVMLLALARALRPPLRATTRRVALQAVPINKGGKRGSRRQRHELRTLDFSRGARAQAESTI